MCIALFIANYLFFNSFRIAISSVFQVNLTTPLIQFVHTCQNISYVCSQNVNQNEKIREHGCVYFRLGNADSRLPIPEQKVGRRPADYYQMFECL